MVSDGTQDGAGTRAAIGSILIAEREAKAAPPPGKQGGSLLGRPLVAVVAVAILVGVVAMEYRAAAAVPALSAEAVRELNEVARARLVRAYEYAESVRAVSGAYPASLDAVRDSLALGPIEYVAYDGRFSLYTRVGTEPVWVGSAFDLEAFRKDGSRVPRVTAH